jgi:small subunit ribosomal protein S8
MMTDPIADMLTRIRNGAGARKASVDVPWSRHKEAIARVLVAEGYLADAAMVREEGEGGAGGRAFPTLRIGLRYDQGSRPVITGVRRVSRPSLRIYVGHQDIPSVRRGLGVSILSTPKGILADREARRQGVGGEVICQVW